MELIYRIQTIRIESRLDHTHFYGGTVAGNWTWCDKCQCMVNNKCDHRKFPCRQRAAAMKLARADGRSSTPAE